MKLKTYAEENVFEAHEVELWKKAVVIVERMPTAIDGALIRCHELARAVGQLLELEVCDGKFGFVEHSWLWTGPFEQSHAPWVLPNILDVYVPGSLPAVQLVHTYSGLPTRYTLNPIIDLVVREDVVKQLVERAGWAVPRHTLVRREDGGVEDPTDFARCFPSGCTRLAVRSTNGATLQCERSVGHSSSHIAESLSWDDPRCKMQICEADGSYQCELRHGHEGGHRSAHHRWETP